MKVQDIDTAARQILQDPSSKRWTAANVSEWVHEGELEVVANAPRAATITTNIDLAGGQCQQTLAATYSALLDIVTDMGADGATPGNSISRTDVDRMQAAKRDWRRDRGTPRQFMLDERDPRLFYVWPGPSDARKVEARVVVLPTLKTGMNDVLSVSDDWKVCLAEFVLYKAFAKDASDAANLQRAAAHYANFARIAGIKLAARAKAGPGGNSPANPAYPAVEKNGA